MSSQFVKKIINRKSNKKVYPFLFISTWVFVFDLSAFHVQENNIVLTQTEPTSSEQVNLSSGQILFHLSLPYMNGFHFNVHNEGTKNNFGFMGYSFGLDYFYQTNRFLSLSFSEILDYYRPFAFVGRSDEYEGMNSYVINFANFYKINQFSIGYGLHFSKNRWSLVNNFWNEDSSARIPYRKDNNAVGLSLNTYYQISRYFYLGLVYRPSIISLNNKPMFSYEHSISIDFALKFNIKN